MHYGIIFNIGPLHKRLMMKNLFILLLITATANVLAQTDSSPSEVQISSPPASTDTSSYSCDLSGKTTISTEYAQWLQTNCQGPNRSSQEERDDGITTYTDITLLFEDGQVTERIQETTLAAEGNLGDEFPPNIALPIKPNNTNITKISDITQNNYNSVLRDNVLNLINTYKSYYDQGFEVKDEIKITSTADRATASRRVPVGGYSQEQVDNSYSIGGLIQNPTNEKLAENRGNNIRTLILNLVSDSLAEKIKVESITNQSTRRVDISEVQFIKITSPDGRTITIEDVQANPENQEDEDSTVTTVTVNPDGKTKETKKPMKLWKKILIGAGIAAAIGGAAYGISRIGKSKRNNTSNSPAVTPTTVMVDPSIDGWKYLTSSKRCIPYKFNPNLLDGKIYFKTQDECKPPTESSVPSADTENEVSINPKKPKPKPTRDVVKPTIISANEYDDDTDYSELPEQQILNLANTGNVHTTDLGYCAKSSYKLLQPCPMTKHANQHVRRQKGITKYFGRVTIVCQYIENKAKYTTILEKDCTEQ